MVGEFPELQGLMGKYYALAQGEDASVAAASEEHYKPQGPADRVPTDPVSVAVALADKIDTLVGFWAIDEKPTGSKDPYALRRAALGVIRLIVENALRVSILRSVPKSATSQVCTRQKTAVDDSEKLPSDLLAFFADRLKVQLRDQGARHDLVDAVFCARRPGRSPDGGPPRRGARQIPRHRRRQEPARRHQARRATSCAIEEKKDGKAYDGAPDAALYKLDEEKTLAKAIDQVKAEAGAAVAKEDFAAAMSAMAKLRPAVDAFFDKVKVNDDDAKVRENRLKLLNEIRAATRAVADFSKIQD